MKKLTLVRHAKSSRTDDSCPDFARTLNKRGKKDAPKMGKILAKEGYYPDVIISSPAARAWKTAKKMAGAMEYPAKTIRAEPHLYEADLIELMRIICGLDDRWGSVMIVGHNPSLGDFGRTQLDTPVLHMPTNAVLELEKNVATWKDARVGLWRCTGFIHPGMYHCC